MKWKIVADSSCDLPLNGEQRGEVTLTSVPFIISAGDRDFIDEVGMDTGEMLSAIEAADSTHTSCPAPQTWMDAFADGENILAVTISSNLSGSYNSAMSARAAVLEQYPDKQIAVLDSFSTGPEMTLFIHEALRLIEGGAEFSAVEAFAREFFLKTKIVFALCSFDNLVKNGRMSKIAGFIARKLGMWGIGIGSDEGTIVIKGKTRGTEGALRIVLDDLRDRGFTGGRVLIAHAHNLAMAEKLKARIEEVWENSAVDIMPTRGLCSYYAERSGLIVSY